MSNDIKNWQRLVKAEIRFDDGSVKYNYDKRVNQHDSIEFHVQDGVIESKPAECFLKLYNRNNEFIERVKTSKGIDVIISAGYYDTGLIELGGGPVMGRVIGNEVQDYTIVLKFSSINDIEFKHKEIDVIKKNTTLKNVILTLLDGKQDLNIDNDIANKKLTKGFIHKGSIIESLNALSRKYKFNVNYINRTVNITPLDNASSNAKIFEIGANSGLIGKPIIKDNMGVEIKMLMNPNIQIGDKIKLKLKKPINYKSDKISSHTLFKLFEKERDYIVTSVVHTGGSTMGDFYTNLITRAL